MSRQVPSVSLSQTAETGSDWMTKSRAETGSDWVTESKAETGADWVTESRVVQIE